MAIMVPNAPVRDAVTGEFNTDLVGQQIQIIDGLVSTPTAYPIQDGATDPIPSSLLTVQAPGQLPTYWIDVVDPSDLYMDWYHAASGARGRVDFDAALRDSAKASAASSAASAASALASQLAAEAVGPGSVLTWGTLDGKPDTFPPSGHTHVRSEISDATTVGQALIAAIDPQAARAAIGAGTGNGTSNLAIGTTATTAAAGNHTHAQYVDSAQARTIADEQIALSGGGSGGGSIYVWEYRSGAYPALPATKPAGVVRVDAAGPIQPSVVPSWIGPGTTQARLRYDYDPTLT